MFSFLKEKLSKIYAQVTSKLSSLFSSSTVDENTLNELERILLEADTGVQTTRLLIDRLRQQEAAGKLQQGHELKNALAQELKALLGTCTYTATGTVFILVGVNGTGKTTFAAKLAAFYTLQGKKVLLAAADTFRAAAVEQLRIWASRSGVTCISGPESADPASVVFNACKVFTNEAYDILIIDTAGRLQNKVNLMRELEKVRKVIDKQLPSAPITTLLTIDSLLGQNSLDQAQLFHQATNLDGIVLTKMDGTGKGGIVFAICKEVGVPIAYISYGEHLDQMSRFDPDTYVDQLLE